MKKSRNIGYLFKEGFRGLFVHGFMSFASICVTVACLIIIGTFSMLLYNLSLKIDKLEKENQVIAYVDISYTRAQAQSVGSKINLIANVNEAVFVTREQALESFIAEQGDKQAYAGVLAEDFEDRYEITLVENELMEQTISELGDIQGISEVVSHPEIVEGLFTTQRVLNIVSMAIIIVLLVVSLFIISNTIKLAMYDRQDEIAIMKMVGATNSFIRFPYVVEGFIIGILSAIIAFFAEWGIYNLLETWIQATDAMQLFEIVAFDQVIWIIAATFATTGLFVGVFGSLMSIRKFLDV